MRSRVARRLLAMLAPALALGCATPAVDFEELPEAPLALVYRTLAQGRERADRIRDLRGEKPQPGADGRGVVQLDQVGDFLDRLRGRDREIPPELQGRLALYHPRTKEVEILEAFLPGAFPSEWSPDRRRLLVVSRRHGSADLYEYSFDRGLLAPVLPAGADRVRGSYGPDGRLAFVQVERTRRGVAMTLWVTERGFTQEHPISEGPSDHSVRWVLGGHTLLYQSLLRNGQPVIKTLDLDDERLEPRVIARGVDPALSPRGDWVVYSRDRGEGYRLWRMRPNGTGKSALGARTQGAADERNPTISPDGRFVAYVAQEEERQRIRVRRMDGTGDRLLLEDGDGMLPVW